MSCAIIHFNPRIAFFSKMTTFKEKSVYVVFSICNLELFQWGGDLKKSKKKKSQRCSNSHKSQQRPRGSCSLIGQRRCQSSAVSSAATPTDAQRRRSFHRQWYSKHLRLVCGWRREERRKRAPPQTQRVRSGERRRAARHRRRKGCGVTGEPCSGSDLRRGLCNCPCPPPFPSK